MSGYQILKETLTKQLDWAGDDEIEKATALLAGTMSPLDVPSTEKWVRGCYNTPAANEQLLHALNDVLNCAGVESVDLATVDFPCGEDANGIEIMDRADIDKAFEMLNVGDPYVTTLIMMEGDVYLAGYGDMIAGLEGAAVEEAINQAIGAGPQVPRPDQVPEPLTDVLEAARSEVMKEDAPALTQDPGMRP